MVDGAIRDFNLAKRKAAERLRIDQRSGLPSNEEVEIAREAYLKLFHGDAFFEQLRALRKTALEAMKFLSPFDPHLVGPILRGSADENSPVYLHLFADTAEEVILFLGDRHVPFDIDERRVRFNDRDETLPMLRWFAGEVAIEVTIFPIERLRRPPLSPIDGKPTRRADRDAVEKLLAEPQ